MILNQFESYKIAHDSGCSAQELVLDGGRWQRHDTGASRIYWVFLHGRGRRERQHHRLSGAAARPIPLMSALDEPKNRSCAKGMEIPVVPWCPVVSGCPFFDHALAQTEHFMSFVLWFATMRQVPRAIKGFSRYNKLTA